MRLIAKLSCTLAVSALLAGCTVGPDFQAPAAPAMPERTAASYTAQLDGTVAVRPDWWRAFGDATLDEIEAAALAANLDLELAKARIGAARADLRIAGAALLPEIGAAASYRKVRGSPNGVLSLLGGNETSVDDAAGDAPFGTAVASGENNGGAFDLYQAGFDASWELDLWGKARRRKEAASADYDSARLDLAALRVALSAEVARTYITLRAVEAREAVTRRNRETVSSSLHIAERRFQTGAASTQDQAQARTRLADIDDRLVQLGESAARLRNALARLIAAEPHALDDALVRGAGRIPSLPDTLPATLSSQLARHRPDIARAEARLHAATARIGEAKADFYPALALGGSFGLQSLTTAGLPEWNARQFAVGPVLHLPIFQGGRLSGQLALRKADMQRAAIDYRATVLAAWHEIDDSLDNLSRQASREALAREGVEQSRIALRVSRRRYEKGASGYLDQLVAQAEALDSETRLVDARAQRATALVGLYKAMGGGWSPQDLAAPTGSADGTSMPGEAAGRAVP